jgi:hypothetical protein
LNTDYTNCTTDNKAIYSSGKCICNAGYYCAQSQNPTPGNCEAGNYCPRGSKKKEGCDTCQCGYGYYCPETSTTRYGQPVSAEDDNKCPPGCPVGGNCLCSVYHFCPPGSKNCYGGICGSDKNEPCACPEGTYGNSFPDSNGTHNCYIQTTTNYDNLRPVQLFKDTNNSAATLQNMFGTGINENKCYYNGS